MPEAPTPNTDTPAAEAPQDKPDAAEEVVDWQDRATAQQKVNRDLERKLKDAQAQLDAINQANETAVEKAQRELKEARDSASQAQQDALRFRIAAESGITDNTDLILTGSDEDTMRKQAQLWLANKGQAGPAGPRPDLSQGAKGTPATGDPAQDFANFIGAQMGN